MSTMLLKIQEEESRVVTIRVTTRLDAFSVLEFRAQMQAIFEQGVRHLVIDLSQTPFLDSTGMAVLVSALKQCRQRGGDVRLVAPQSEAVKRILDLTKFDRVFDIKSTHEEAVAAFHAC